jgi:hypothetical protein
MIAVLLADPAALISSQVGMGLMMEHAVWLRQSADKVNILYMVWAGNPVGGEDSFWPLKPSR